MDSFLQIGTRCIDNKDSVYIIAEISANHGQNFDHALRLIQAAKDADADAVKFQAYTPDTMTIQSDRPEFRISSGTIWDGKTLYDLYSEAYTPWEWFPRLKEYAESLDLDFFATAFDPTAVDFLEGLDVPIHKIASFEIVDIPLIKKVAQTGKPMIISTGMATLGEIEEAVNAAREAGAKQIALLKCTSAYPAPPEEMNLRTIPHMAEAFGVPVGLSDHTLGIAVPVAAVALGACIVEKHFTLSRDMEGPDSAFSLEPHELKTMVDAIRVAEKALGKVQYGPRERELNSKVFRRSLYVVKDIKAGEQFTEENVKSIRPGYGLAPKYLHQVIGQYAVAEIQSGSPLDIKLVR